ncbi:hypothetical protein KRX19_03865 [Cardiobacteriaceae bacterium TAE3-ERU3]|nr:hypothetical protein [Cardiobacteriaceae bacterium TAE3-ERU3]
MRFKRPPPSKEYQDMVRYLFNHLEEAIRLYGEEIIEQLITLFKIPVLKEEDVGEIISYRLDKEELPELTLTLKPNSEKTDMDIRVKMNYCCPSEYYGDIKFHFDVMATLTANGGIDIDPDIKNLTIDSPPACFYTYQDSKFSPVKYGDLEALWYVIIAFLEDWDSCVYEIARQCIYNNMPQIFDELARFKSKGKGGILIDKKLVTENSQKAELQ